MDRDDTPLAPRDLLILSVLAAGDEPGYGINKAVEDRSDATVKLDPAKLYRAHRRMRRDVWIEEVDSSEGAARRRTYGITMRGRSVLRLEVDRLEHLLSEVRPALASPGRS